MLCKLTVRIFLLGLLITGPYLSTSQNLVRDPSFENYLSCPSSIGQWSKLIDWTSKRSSPDYENSCWTINDRAGIKNAFGYQVPATGNGYVHIICHNTATTPPNPREFLGGSLLSPMVVGTTYEVRFKVSMANHSKYAVEGLGIKFFVTDQPQPVDTVGNVADVELDYLLDDTLNWVEIKGCITADQPYEYLIIGNWRSIPETNPVLKSGGCHPLIGCSTYGSYYVDDIYVGPFEKLLPDTSYICNGESSILDVTISNGQSYLWQDNSTGPIYTATVGGTYTVEITTLEGCIIHDTVEVIERNAPGVDLGPDTTFCLATSFDLDAGPAPGFTYLWSTTETTQSITTTASGQYYVTVSDGFCNVSDTIELTFNTALSVDLGPDTTICTTLSYLMDAGTLGVTSYVWNNGETSSAITSDTSGTFSVIISDGNCFAYDTVSIIVDPIQTFDLGSDISTCPGNTVTLTAGLTGVAYTWSTNQGTPTIDVNSAGQYWVSVTNGNCTESDTINVAFDGELNVDLGSDSAFCDGGSINLSVSTSGLSYLWSTTETTQSITVSASGIYSVIVDDNGCTGHDTVIITVGQPPSISLGSDNVLCQGDIATLDAGISGITYLWSTSETSQSIQVSDSGLYKVTVNDGICESSDSVRLTFKPEIELGSDTLLCNGSTLTLDAKNSGGTYLWSTSETTQTISASDSGLYWVRVTEGNCTHSDTIRIDAAIVPDIDLGEDVNLCDGEVLTLDAGNITGATYLWSTGETGSSIIANEPGTYSVSISTNCGSSNSDINLQCNSSLFVPNTFTPNGTFTNEVFYAYGTNIIDFEMIIFDRWGAEVFVSNDLSFGWNGLINNVKAPEDTYIYSVSYKDLESRKHTVVGHVNLIR